MASFQPTPQRWTPGWAPDAPLSPEEGREWLARRRVRPAPQRSPAAVDMDADPRDPQFARRDISETPGGVLHFWFAYAADHAAAVADRMALWFGADFDVDAAIARRFGDLLAQVASGGAQRWAARGPRERLAAILVLDQFSRNIFRGTPGAFENDPLARLLAREGLHLGEDQALHPVERWFMYMPFMHSESTADQRLSIARFTALAESAPAGYEDALGQVLHHAKQHAATIRRFGRFPSRNAALGRETTPDEDAWLRKNRAA
jgi:uncharacterized protein (DUF924 family)